MICIIEIKYLCLDLYVILAKYFYLQNIILRINPGVEKGGKYKISLQGWKNFRNEIDNLCHVLICYMIFRFI